MTVPSFCLPRRLLEDIRAHAAEAAPSECVGLIFGNGENATRTLRLENVAKTPKIRFFAPPQALFAALTEADRLGEALLANYHSHLHSAAFPSPSDLAAPDGTVQLIVGRDAVRVFLLQGGEATELELELL